MATVTINIRINGKMVELSRSEAERIYNELEEALGYTWRGWKITEPPTTIPRWVPETGQPWPKMPDVWCSTRVQLNS